jgi:hypothetical protein
LKVPEKPPGALLPLTDEQLKAVAPFLAQNHEMRIRLTDEEQRRLHVLLESPQTRAPAGT